MSNNNDIDSPNSTERRPETRMPEPTTGPGTGVTGQAEGRRMEGEWNASWMGGLILILIGSVFLIQNITGFWLHNWWALFIAIPGVFALMGAWRLYERNGNRFTGQVAAAAMGAVFPLLIAAIFLFRLDWGEVWPLFLIAAGLVALLPRALERQG